MASLARFLILEAHHLTSARRSVTEPTTVQISQPPFSKQLPPRKVSISSELFIKAIESINMALTIHHVNDAKQNLLIDQ